MVGLGLAFFLIGSDAHGNPYLGKPGEMPLRINLVQAIVVTPPLDARAKNEGFNVPRVSNAGIDRFAATPA